MFSTPPALMTYSINRSSPFARRNSNTCKKFDLPDPFAPIKMLIGFSFKFSTDLKLLNPLIVMYSTVFAGIYHHHCKYLVPAAIQSLRDLTRDPSAAPHAILRPKASRVLPSEI